MGTFLDKYGLLRNGKPKTPITIREIIGKSLATKKISSSEGPIGDLNKTFKDQRISVLYQLFQRISKKDYVLTHFMKLIYKEGTLKANLNCKHKPINAKQNICKQNHPVDISGKIILRSWAYHSNTWLV